MTTPPTDAIKKFLTEVFIPPSERENGRLSADAVLGAFHCEIILLKAEIKRLEDIIEKFDDVQHGLIMKGTQ